MNLLEDSLFQYTEGHTSPESDLLRKINRETHSQILMPQMLSGHLQGRILAFFSKMIKPTRVLEIGTYTGYSSICLAEGLKENGTLITIDINEELEQRVRAYFAEARLTDRIQYLVGDALDIIPDLEGPFDLVFIDADKTNYRNYYDLVFDKISPGGHLIADNVLWGGKVVENTDDEETVAIKDFNNRIQNDDRVENVLFPVRDGIMVVRKK